MLILDRGGERVRGHVEEEKKEARGFLCARSCENERKIKVQGVPNGSAASGLLELTFWCRETREKTGIVS